VARDSRAAAHKTESVDHAHAAALPLVTLTAWEALYDRLDIQKGETVLIHAGGGGGEVFEQSMDCVAVNGRICTIVYSPTDQACDKLFRKNATLNFEFMGNPVLVPPRPVTVHQSSNRLSVRDPLVTKALALIEDRIHENLTVQRLLRDLPVSRNTPDKRFREIVGRSVAEHMRFTRLEGAKRLLREARMSLVEIVVACGYSDSAQLCRAIKDDCGMTPTRYRRRRADESVH